MSNWSPPTYSSTVSVDLPSSTVITPSLPVFSTASASRFPIAASWFAEIVATAAVSLRPSSVREMPFRASTTAATALSIPRFTSVGFAPEEIAFRPSR